MKGLIDLDELLQYPLRRGSEHYDEKNADPHFLFGVESVLEYAQTLPTLTKPNGWISVEDRLPNDNDINSSNSAYFLCCIISPYQGGVAQKYERVILFDNLYREWKCNDCIVTHWRPLPEPPEED